MATLRDILNEQKWRYDALSDVAITVVHRGAPGDIRVIGGEDIVDIGATGLIVEADLSVEDWEDQLDDEVDETGFIPYHRILRIESTRELLWVKNS